MALAAYEPGAADRLARELDSSERSHRHRAAELLLDLGDARGIPLRLDALEFGAAVFGASGLPGDDDAGRGVRMFACRDLRVFSQQPLPCDPRATGASLKEQVAMWRGWWHSRPSGSPLATRQARLDLEAIYDIRPVTIGEFLAR